MKESDKDELEKVKKVENKKTTSKANPNFEYLDKLLTDWHDRSLKTPNEVQSFLTQMKENLNKFSLKLPSCASTK